MPANYCHLCGTQLLGQGNQLDHKNWSQEIHLTVCDICYKNNNRCRYCQLPLAAENPLDVCPTCARSVLICLSCGNAINEEYVNINGSGPYCQTCYTTRAHCDICSAPLTDNQWQLSDGRISCAYCHATAVDDPQQAIGLFDEIRIIIFERIGLSLNIPTGLALVDRVQLKSIIQQQMQSTSSSPGQIDLDIDKTLGIYTRRGIRRGIYVQSGLPRNLLIQIAAHEFAHAWQGENCPLLRDQLIHEGFAEWVSYHVLEAYNLKQQQIQMRKRNDIYGEGLRWALEIESYENIKGVIGACLAAQETVIK